MGWVDALKYGAPGLASLALLWTANLLRLELKHNTDVRASARKLIYGFMAFAVAMVLIGAAGFVYDKQSSNQLVKIQGLAKEVDTDLHYKANIENLFYSRSNPESRKELCPYLLEYREHVATLCKDANEINKAAGGGHELAYCRSQLGDWNEQKARQKSECPNY